jgi:hypothetical protein
MARRPHTRATGTRVDPPLLASSDLDFLEGQVNHMVETVQLQATAIHASIEALRRRTA